MGRLKPTEAQKYIITVQIDVRPSGQKGKYPVQPFYQARLPETSTQRLKPSKWSTQHLPLPTGPVSTGGKGPTNASCSACSQTYPL